MSGRGPRGRVASRVEKPNIWVRSMKTRARVIKNRRARRADPHSGMQGGDGNFYVGGGDEGGGRAPPAATYDVDASFHSPAWQEAYLKSLTETRPSYDEFKQREKDREGKLAAAAEQAERETLAFRKQLAADRERRLAGGTNRLGVKSGKVKKSKKEKKGKKKKSKGKSKKSKKSKRRRDSSDSSSSSDSDSDSGESRGKKDDDDVDKYRLSGFFAKQDDE